MNYQQFNIAITACLASVFLAAPVKASDTWVYDAALSLEAEQIEHEDNAALTSKPFDGGQLQYSLNWSATKHTSPYESQLFFGRVNGENSEYIDYENDLSVSSLGYVWEKGDAALPFRLQAGDFQGYYSYRSLFRNAKGLQLELQPKSIALSSQITAGTLAQNYAAIDKDDPHIVANSNLFSLSENSGLMANVVYSGVKNNADESLSQWVGGIGYFDQFTLANMLVDWELEYNQFDGDSFADLSAISVENDSADSLYFGANATGPNGQFARLQLERTDDNYTPVGSVTTDDRYRARLDYGQSAGQGKITTSAEWTRDEVSSDNPVTRVSGSLAWSGTSLWGKPASQQSNSLQVYRFHISQNKDDLDSRDSLSVNLSAQRRGQIGSWFAQFAVATQLDEDRIGDEERKFVEVSTDLDRSSSWNSWRGSLSLGLTARRTVEADNYWEVAPRIALSARRKLHEFYVKYDLRQIELDEQTDASRQHALVAGYGWRNSRHRLRIELGLDAREGGLQQQDGSAYFAKLNYTWLFDNKPAQALNPASFESAKASFSTEQIFSALRIGQSRESANLQLVQMLGLSLSTQAKDPQKAVQYQTYDALVFSNLPTGQRIVVGQQQGQLSLLGVYAEADQGSAKQLEQMYSIVKRELTLQFGQPSREVAQGDFESFNAIQGISGQIQHFSDWQLNGNLLRVGVAIPDSLNARIEVILTADVLGERNWGLCARFDAGCVYE